MKKVLLAVMLSSFAVAAHADVVGGTSNTEKVLTGASNKTIPQVAEADAFGKAGIAMPTIQPDGPNAGEVIVDEKRIVSLEYGPIRQTNDALKGVANGHGYIDLKTPAGTVRMAETWKHTAANGNEVYAYRQMRDALKGFPQFGGQVIGKVTGLPEGTNVYFGEWAPMVANPPAAGNDLNMNHADRTAWYVGENSTKTMPTLVNAQYDVTGIKRFAPADNGGLVAGVLTANYGNGSGNITGQLGDVNFAGTNINANGTFARGSDIEGRFYGDQAQALAGMHKNGVDSMAFGGKKK